MKFIVTRFKGFLQYWDLFCQLVAVDVKLKYRRSLLGYFWSILNPLLIMLVMVMVFSYFFRQEIPNFPVYLLCGNTLFGFMNEATNRGIGSIVGNGPMLRKTYIPKYIFTIASVTSALVNMLFSMAALILVMAFTKTQITGYIVFTPLVLLELYVFSLGLALFLASATVFFRDVQYLWSVVLTAWMYMTPIFYPVTIWPENVAIYFKMLNPMYSYIAQFRDLVLYGQMPGDTIIWSGIGYAVLALMFGVWVFYRGQDRFILYI